MNELISVIMSTYNEEEAWLRKSVESILCQTYTNFEFLIVLDNPQNAAIKEVLQEYGRQDSRIRLIYNEENIGLVRSLNKALGQAEGTLIARMDADDISYPDRLELEYRAMEERQADFVMGTVDYINEKEVIDTHTFEKEYYGSAFARILKAGNISAHPTWLVKKEVYDRLKGYRPVECCEDLDFVLRALQAGYTCLRMQKHILAYRMRSTGVSRSRTLEQFLTMRYIRRIYRRGKSLEAVTQEDWTSDFKKVTGRQAEKFDRALQLFWQGKEELGQKHYGSFAAKSVKSMMKSRYFFQYFWDNVIWMISVKVI